MSATVFPAFIRAEFVDDGSAKSAFLRSVDSMAAPAEKRFKDLGDEMARQLNTALSSSRNSAGALDIGASAARAAAQAAQARATAAREIAFATATAAKAEQDYSESARLSVAAARALAVQEEQSASAALSHANALEQVQAQLNKTASATSAVLTGTGRMAIANDNAATSAGAHRAALQNLSYQIGDVAQGLAMGISPMTIFAQQGGQVVQALSLMKGGATGLVGFLASPWGAVLSGAAMIAGTFGAKLLESGNAADTAADQYRNAAAAARELAGAQNAYKRLDAEMKANKLREEQLSLENLVAKKPYAADPNQPFFTMEQRGGSAARRLAAIKQELLPLQNQLRLAEQISAELDKAATAGGRHGASVHRTAGEHGKGSQAASDYARALEAVGKAYDRANQGGQWGSSSLASRMDLLSQRTLADGKFGFPVAEAQTAAQQLAEDSGRAFKALTDQTERWNAQLDASIDNLTRIGGIGGKVAGWAKALRGDFSALPGSTGVALQTALSIQVGRGPNNEIVKLGDRLETLFSEGGKFGKTMSNVLQGAGTGGAFSTLVFGQNNQGAQIGGMLGGVAGKIAGEAIGKTVGKTLGSALGPLGSIAGSLLGGAIGSLFGSKPRGSGSVTQDTVTTTANNAGIKASLDSFGLGLQQAVSKIATQLGGKVGNYGVGLGNYKGKYFQVSSNPNDPYLGQAEYYRKSSQEVYDGEDATAALRAAISEAIKDGAIQGVRAGTQTLLKAGKDIEAQLQKALSFEGVFTSLKEYTDPVGAAMDALNKKFEGLKDTFKEAGATTEEYGKLEQLYNIERTKSIKQAIEQTSGALKSLLDDLTIGNNTRSLRDREAAAKAALDPLAARVAAGDTTAYDEFATASRAFLDISRQLNGSQGAYFAVEDQIKALTQGALSSQQAKVDAANAAALNADSPFAKNSLAGADNANVVSAIDAQSDMISAKLDALNGNVNNLAALIASGKLNPATILPTAARYW